MVGKRTGSGVTFTFRASTRSHLERSGVSRLGLSSDLALPATSMLRRNERNGIPGRLKGGSVSAPRRFGRLGQPGQCRRPPTASATQAKALLLGFLLSLSLLHGLVRHPFAPIPVAAEAARLK